MTGLCIAVFLLLLLLLAPIKAMCEYEEGGFSAFAGLGPLMFKVYPAKPGKKEKKAKPKKPAKKKEETKTGKKPGSFRQYLDFLPILTEFVGKLKRKLVIEKLEIHYLAAAESPASAALQFGAASAAFGIVLPALENNFKVKKRDLTADVSFQEPEPKIYVKAQIALRVWSALYLSSKALWKILKTRKKQTAQINESER